MLPENSFGDSFTPSVAPQALSATMSGIHNAFLKTVVGSDNAFIHGSVRAFPGLQFIAPGTVLGSDGGAVQFVSTSQLPGSHVHEDVVCVCVCIALYARAVQQSASGPMMLILALISTMLFPTYGQTKYSLLSLQSV